MGLTKVVLQIINPGNKSKTIKGEFLVDSGAFYTVLPKRMVDKLGLKPELTREFGLADGTTIKRALSSAYITFGDDTIASPVILGKTGDNPLMGVLTLESFGLILDPFKRELHPAKLML